MNELKRDAGLVLEEFILIGSREIFDQAQDVLATFDDCLVRLAAGMNRGMSYLAYPPDRASESLWELVDDIRIEIGISPIMERKLEV